MATRKRAWASSSAGCSCSYVIGAFGRVPVLRPFRGPFSAVSTSIFAAVDSFRRILQALEDYLKSVPDFAKFQGFCTFVL